MTFEEREKKIFFDVISDLTGHHSQHGHILIGLTREHILNRVGARITPKRAEELFNEFFAIKYLEDQSDEKTYRISDSGRTLYFEHLKQEDKKAELDKKSVESNIRTGLFTRTNIIVGVVLAALTFVFIVLNFILSIFREQRESEREKRELLKEIQNLQKSTQPNTHTNQIDLRLPDSLLLKVKNE